jgi:phosphoribosylformylglycinamidine synthase subunit PurL
MLCMGIKPLAISAFLYHINFADPNGQYISSGAKKGLERAAEKFNLKISGRKIRFDHFSEHGPVLPTLIISMSGVVTQKDQIMNHALKRKGSDLFLIGRSVEDLGSSEYLEFFHGIADSPLPSFYIEDEIKIQETLRELHRGGFLESASPIGKGGLFFTLLRAAIPSGLGFDITTAAEIRMDSFLFGEAMGRILVEVLSDKEDAFVDAMSSLKIPFFTLGHVTKGEIRIDDESFGYIDKMPSGI